MNDQLQFGRPVSATHNLNRQSHSKKSTYFSDNHSRYFEHWFTYVKDIIAKLVCMMGTA